MQQLWILEQPLLEEVVLHSSESWLCLSHCSSYSAICELPCDLSWLHLKDHLPIDMWTEWAICISILSKQMTSLRWAGIIPCSEENCMDLSSWSLPHTVGKNILPDTETRWVKNLVEVLGRTLKAFGNSKDSTSLSKGMKSTGNSPITISPYTPSSWKMRSHSVVFRGMKNTANSCGGPGCLAQAPHH